MEADVGRRYHFQYKSDVQSDRVLKPGSVKLCKIQKVRVTFFALSEASDSEALIGTEGAVRQARSTARLLFLVDKPGIIAY
jgi:hypothetical protein